MNFSSAQHLWPYGEKIPFWENLFSLSTIKKVQYYYRSYFEFFLELVGGLGKSAMVDKVMDFIIHFREYVDMVDVQTIVIKPTWLNN